MALWQESGRCLCDLGCFGPVVLPLGRVALDFSGGRLGLLVERWAGLRLLQRRVTVPARQELSHTLFQELDVHLVTALLQREFRKCIRLQTSILCQQHLVSGSAKNTVSHAREIWGFFASITWKNTSKLHI